MHLLPKVKSSTVSYSQNNGMVAMCQPMRQAESWQLFSLTSILQNVRCSAFQ